MYQRLFIGEKFILTAFPFPAMVTTEKADDFNIEWESSNPDIIAVINGLIIPKQNGSAIITAKLSGTNISDSVNITATKREENQYSRNYRK